MYQQPVYAGQPAYPAQPMYAQQPGYVTGPVYAPPPAYAAPQQQNNTNVVVVNAGQPAPQPQSTVYITESRPKKCHISSTQWILCIILCIFGCPIPCLPCLFPCCYDYY